MSEPTRYDWGEDGCDPDPLGTYVTHADYARLRSAFDELLGEVRSIQQEIVYKQDAGETAGNLVTLVLNWCETTIANAEGRA